jgi:hypothetical protein
MFFISVPETFKVGDTTDCRINGVPQRLTWRDKNTLVIEPDATTGHRVPHVADGVEGLIDTLSQRVGQLDAEYGLEAVHDFLQDIVGDDERAEEAESRELMHRLIQHFLCIAPSWLLLELDSAATNQASPYLRHGSDIVPIGRLKLIPGTNGGGMQNFAWYHFDARHAAGPVMHPRGSAPADVRRCAECGRPYHATRSDSRFCDDTCRQRAHRCLAGRSRDTAVTGARQMKSMSEPDDLSDW